MSAPSPFFSDPPRQDCGGSQKNSSVRIAAFGDVHAGAEMCGRLHEQFAHLPERADVLLLAGDLTKCGTPDEARVLADELGPLPVPKLAVLGNHDYHADQQDKVTAVLEDSGIRVLDGQAEIVELGGQGGQGGVRLGVAGVKGFGGGFAGACGSDFGEPEMKAFVGHTKRLAEQLERRLTDLAEAGVDFRVALMHYSPIPETLQGERLEIYPFLGSYLLAEAVDRAGADLALHGHAHGGSEKGTTPAGVHVRNVAQPVIKAPYRVYCLSAAGEPDCEAPS